MKSIKSNPTEGVVNQNSVNITEGFDPISSQINIVLVMMKEHFEWEIEKKEDFVKFLKKDDEKDLEYLKYEETDLFELKYLNDLVINLQQQLGGQ